MTGSQPRAGLESVDASTLRAWARHLGRPVVPDLEAVLGAGTIAAAATATAQRVPSAEAIRVGEQALTHGELDDRARRLAS